jgi:N-acetyl-gamma-glutamyl-phosphate reductase
LRAGIIGVTGYGGLELFRLLSAHPEIQQVFLYSSSKEGSLLSDDAQHLFGLTDPLRSLEQLESDELDVLFSSAPSGVSTKLLPPFINRNMKVIDLAGDYRLKDAEVYEKWYGKEAPEQSFVNKAVYGLTEWNRSSIQQADLIANPGCYPTASLLGILPVLKADVIDPSSLIIDAKSGMSGAGATPQKASHFTQANDSMSIYKINKHQHIPEIEQTVQTLLDVEVNITFSTHLIPMTRGIMATIYADLKDGVHAKTVKEIYEECYTDQPFVRVFAENSNLFTKQVYGSNYCDISFAVDPRMNRITIVSVIDNIMKGAAGQAVQNMNVMFGFEEGKGISQTPIFP